MISTSWSEGSKLTNIIVSALEPSWAKTTKLTRSLSSTKISNGDFVITSSTGSKSSFAGSTSSPGNVKDNSSSTLGMATTS